MLAACGDCHTTRKNGQPNMSKFLSGVHGLVALGTGSAAFRASAQTVEGRRREADALFVRDGQSDV